MLCVVLIFFVSCWEFFNVLCTCAQMARSVFTYMELQSQTIMFKCLAGYEFDYIFDWTILKYQQTQKSKTQPRVSVSILLYVIHSFNRTTLHGVMMFGAIELGNGLMEEFLIFPAEYSLSQSGFRKL